MAWSLEIRIPFSSLRYGREAQPTWGILLYRNYPRDRRYQFFSARLPRDVNCFICNSSKLTGLSNLPHGSHLVLAPFATAAQISAPAAGLGSDLESEGVDGEVGLDLKWSPTANMAIDGTVNPDFSQVESDAAQIVANERFALFFPEKRPFFLEGVDLFSTPFQATYTRTITAPRAGVRATGRFGPTAYTALVTQDRGGGVVILPGSQGSGEALQDFTWGRTSAPTTASSPRSAFVRPSWMWATRSGPKKRFSTASGSSPSTSSISSPMETFSTAAGRWDREWMENSTAFIRIELNHDQIRVGDALLERLRPRLYLESSPGRVLNFFSLESFLGQEIDFANGREGTGVTLAGSVSVRPNDHLELRGNASRRWLDVDEAGNSGRLFTAQVERLRATWSFNSRSFVRLIGQYVSNERDSSLYGFPIGPKDASLSGSALFAYKLNWQTVLYAGYGDERLFSAATDELEPSSRQWFTKVSYTWQH